MSWSADTSLLLPRLCTMREADDGSSVPRPLADYRDVVAYVLLGDPGAGKTKSFEQEAAATGGHYVRARDFSTLEPSPEVAGKVLFIDGLDEMRASGGDGRTPLDHVRSCLDRLGRPRFRLSCREADWYGDSDREALTKVTPGGEIKVLHLDPLSDTDIQLLLERKFEISDPEGFVRDAERHGLATLLRNPQTLELMVEAVGDSSKPDSRSGIYELACKKLVSEANKEHRDAKRDVLPPHETLLEAASFLGAVQLLGGFAGFSLDEDAADDLHVFWRELMPPRELPLLAAMASRLFQRDDMEQQRAFVHRSIAEYLGARYLAMQIETRGLPVGRVIALLAGGDGAIVSDLRGLAAWLAVHCRSARAELTDRDPLGVVLYGDVRVFTVEDKRRVLDALRAEAERYAHFRFEDWTAAPFGALATPDMMPVLLALLAAPSRAEADIALLACVLDALLFGPTLSELAGADELPRLVALLDAIARDASHRSGIRDAALEVMLRDLPCNSGRLVEFARDLHAERVEDRDDELLGQLLTALFPEFIKPDEVFDYLHLKRNDRLIGNYRMFWGHHLPEDVPDPLLPELLDQMVIRGLVLWESLDHFQAERMAGRLLARALETHGDGIDDARLYDWLGTGLDEHGGPRIEREHQQRVAVWLGMRSERYKNVLLVAVENCMGKENESSCLFSSSSRLHGAEPPADIVPWFLQRAAAETRVELKRHFFSEAVRQLIRQGKQRWLTLGAIEELAPWIAEHPDFEADLEPFVSCPVNDWQRKGAAQKRSWDAKREERMNGWRTLIREHLDAIREGSAQPHVLHELAQVYLDLYSDIAGETPRERLANFLGNSNELLDATYMGFRRVLDRDDLPSVAEIINLHTNGRMHFVRQPCLVGMTELFACDPAAAMRLDDEVLRKLIAFRLTWGVELKGDWLTAMITTFPTLVAEVLVAYVSSMLRAGRDDLYGIWSLGYGDDNQALVARAAVPRLLENFPLRAKNKHLINGLDPLLKAGLRHLDRPQLASIVSARLGRGSMSAAQRVYWLACGLMMSPDEYERPLAENIGASKVLRGHLGGFLIERERWSGFTTALSESALALLVELLAPYSPPERPMGAHWVSQSMQIADVVHGFINVLGGNPGEAARVQLERLLTLFELTPWYSRFRHAAHVQRIAWRKASFRHVDAAEVCRTLANREPANAADLAALTHEHLHDLARKIRDGNTNDYRQYWSYNVGGNPARPKPENDCRDNLLSDLNERLGRLGIDAIKECYYAEDKRADIRVSFGGAGRFNIPVEIKKDSHKDLWRAIREQLIERYTRDPGTDGFGIYLVFWFGGKDMPLHEGKKPRSAAELQQRLCATLTRDESRRIAVVVIDCELP